MVVLDVAADPLLNSEPEWKVHCGEVLDQSPLPADPRAANRVERVRNRDFTDKVVAHGSAKMTRAVPLTQLSDTDIVPAGRHDG